MEGLKRNIAKSGKNTSNRIKETYPWRSKNLQNMQKGPVIINNAKMKYDADKTMLTTFYKNGIEHVFITNIYDVRIHLVRNRVSIIIGYDFTKQKKIENGFYNAIGILATDDPSPINAGGSVSMGYGMIEWSLKNAMLNGNTLNGLVKFNNEQMFDVRFGSPMK